MRCGREPADSRRRQQHDADGEDPCEERCGAQMMTEPSSETMLPWLKNEAATTRLRRRRTSQAPEREDVRPSSEAAIERVEVGRLGGAGGEFTLL